MSIGSISDTKAVMSSWVGMVAQVQKTGG